MLKPTEFDINKSISLLKDDFYQKILDKPDFQVLVSIFHQSSYNYIIPKIPLENLDMKRVQKAISTWPKSEYGFSYYIPSELNPKENSFVKGNHLNLLYTDRYPYKQISNSQKFKLESKNIVDMSNENFDMFLKSTEICFPDWDNNKEFTTWCLNTSSITMLGVQEENNIVAFGAYMQKPNSDYVLLMNSGTLPEYRRQGLHEYIIKARINRVLEIKKEATFYANTEDKSGSHKGFTKLGFKNGPLYFVYE